MRPSRNVLKWLLLAAATWASAAFAVGETTGRIRGYVIRRIGLVCAYVFTPGQMGRAINSDEAAGHLARPIDISQGQDRHE